MEKTSHPLQIAPFLLVVDAITLKATMEPCRPNSNDWLHIRASAHVFGVFGACPWVDDNDEVQMQTVGFFAANPSLAANDLADGDDITVYIIDRRNQQVIKNGQYKELLSPQIVFALVGQRVIRLVISTVCTRPRMRC